MRYHGYKKRTAITEITGCKWDTGEHDRIKKLFNRREKELDALFDVCPLVADFPEELPEPILVVDEMLKRRP